MHPEQTKKAEKLFAALGVLARAQEFDAGDDDIWVLTACVQESFVAFREGIRLPREPWQESA